MNEGKEVAEKEDAAAAKNSAPEEGSRLSSASTTTPATSPTGSTDTSPSEVLYIFGGSTLRVDSNDCYEIIVSCLPSLEDEKVEGSTETIVGGSDQLPEDAIKANEKKAKKKYFQNRHEKKKW